MMPPRGWDPFAQQQLDQELLQRLREQQERLSDAERYARNYVQQPPPPEPPGPQTIVLDRSAWRRVEADTARDPAAPAGEPEKEPG